MRGWTATITIIALGCVAAASTRPASAQPAKANGVPGPADIGVTGERLQGLEHLDRGMIAFMRQHQIPGASMAIVKNGHLVYARGFGYADVERKEPVLPSSLFRIASISKTITSVTILRLIEQGKLRREDKVFDLLKLEQKVAPNAPLDPRWKQITVSHLLHHESGWDRDKSRDPVENGLEILRFNHAGPPLTTDHLIRYMLVRPLDFDPGKNYAYSNFGYCLLGRIVEAVTGKSYEDHVREVILIPMGIHDMRVGKSQLKDRAPGEVRYYHTHKPPTRPSIFGPNLGEPVSWTYGSQSIEAGDSYGGWIASAVDVVRFATSLDPVSNYKVLSDRGREVMFRRPPGPSGHESGGHPKAIYYACGLEVKPLGPETRINAWHSGKVYGSSSYVLRRFDGVNAVVLFNKSDDGPDFGNLAATFEDDLQKLVDKVSVWPRGNLFTKFAIIPDRKPQSPAPVPRAR